MCNHSLHCNKYVSLLYNKALLVVMHYSCFIKPYMHIRDHDTYLCGILINNVHTSHTSQVVITQL